MEQEAALGQRAKQLEASKARGSDVSGSGGDDAGGGISTSRRNLDSCGMSSSEESERQITSEESERQIRALQREVVRLKASVEEEAVARFSAEEGNVLCSVRVDAMLADVSKLNEVILQLEAVLGVEKQARIKLEMAIAVEKLEMAAHAAEAAAACPLVAQVQPTVVPQEEPPLPQAPRQQQHKEQGQEFGKGVCSRRSLGVQTDNGVNSSPPAPVPIAPPPMPGLGMEMVLASTWDVLQSTCSAREAEARSAKGDRDAKAAEAERVREESGRLAVAQHELELAHLLRLLADPVEQTLVHLVLRERLQVAANRVGVDA
jgi:hypothetical protein